MHYLVGRSLIDVWLQCKVHSHIGFLVEACVEAVRAPAASGTSVSCGCLADSAIDPAASRYATGWSARLLISAVDRAVDLLSSQ